MHNELAGLGGARTGHDTRWHCSGSRRWLSCSQCLAIPHTMVLICLCMKSVPTSHKTSSSPVALRPTIRPPRRARAWCRSLNETKAKKITSARRMRVRRCACSCVGLSSSFQLLWTASLQRSCALTALVVRTIRLKAKLTVAEHEASDGEEHQCVEKQKPLGAQPRQDPACSRTSRSRCLSYTFV